MFASKQSPLSSPDFHDPSLLPSLRYVPEYACYLDAVRLTDIWERHHVLTVCDWHTALCDPDAGAWVKQWLHCGGRGNVGLRLGELHDGFLLVHSYEKVEYEKDIYVDMISIIIIAIANLDVN